MVTSTDHINRVRQFNRFYTRVLGLLNHKLLKSDYSLVEARILFELGHFPGLLAKDLTMDLGIDPAYLSRILGRFEKQGLILKQVSAKDSRKQNLFLTAKGETALNRLQQMSHDQIQASLSHTTRAEQEALLTAMDRIEMIFSGEPPSADMVTIRAHRPGDLGYITWRHAVFYSRAYGFDHTFDAYVAQGMADFIMQFDPLKEHLWVAEKGSTQAGSVGIVKKNEATAQLRWFLVEPEARGNGLGKKLLSEAVEFCRRKNYEQIILWTISNLEVARTLYEKAGFKPVKTQTHEIWGQMLTEEMWQMPLNNK